MIDTGPALRVVFAASLNSLNFVYWSNIEAQVLLLVYSFN